MMMACRNDESRCFASVLLRVLQLLSLKRQDTPTCPTEPRTAMQDPRSS
jgi:hypothetical protein